MTLYVGEWAESAMFEGMLVLYEYRALLMDLMATLLGYLAWRDYTEFNNQIVPYASWTAVQLYYETLYYIRYTIADMNKARCFHHVLCLGFLYFGWAFKTALSTTFFFSSTSNCFLALMQKHPNAVTKVAFGASFVVARIIIGTWIITNLLQLPVQGSERALIPMTSTLYVMQWWWLKQIVRHVQKGFKHTESP